MCLFLVAFIVILLFYASGDIVNYQLIESVEQVVLSRSVGWDILELLWPVMVASFLSGILFVLLLLKLLPSKDKLQ